MISSLSVTITSCQVRNAIATCIRIAQPDQQRYARITGAIRKLPATTGPDLYESMTWLVIQDWGIRASSSEMVYEMATSRSVPI
jgi:hypothetical protein